MLNLKKKTKIKYILSPTTGLDHIDKIFKNNKKYKIFNLTNKKFLSKVRASSEFTLYLLLATLRKIKSINQKNMIGSEINGKIVGVIGLGRIGNTAAKFCKSQGAKVYYTDILIKRNSLFEFKSLNYILSTSDIIIVSIPSTTQNANYLTKLKLNLLKKGAIIINTSRGEILDEKYVLNLAKKKLIFYSSDVIQNEQFVENKKIKDLNSHNNIFITNHIAGMTKESIRLTDQHIYNKFKKFYEKH